LVEHSAPGGHSLWRHVRFSIRGLIVLIFVIGYGLGWIVYCARVQRDAVAAIERAGGNASYNWQESNGQPVPEAQPWWPKWLVERVGVDYFGNVIAVGVGALKGSGARISTAAG
jgi:internalin A